MKGKAPGAVATMDVSRMVRVWLTGGSWDPQLWIRGKEGRDQQHLFGSLKELEAASDWMGNKLERIRPGLWAIVLKD